MPEENPPPPPPPPEKDELPPPPPPSEAPPPLPEEAPPPVAETAPAAELHGEGAPSAPAEAGEAPAKVKKEPKKVKRKYTYELKLFERYDLSEVVVHDPGLARYINLTAIVIPHTGGRWANKPFGKAKANIVERLINGMMRSENFTGKKMKAIRVVQRAFAIIEQKSKQNPVQVLVNALEKASPREEITRLRFGGISVPRAVDVSPSRRLDMALRNICQGVTAASFKSPKPIQDCLADEVLKASRGEMESAAIARKEELERIAMSAR
jgi:small subunit ribosomal protein S7